MRVLDRLEPVRAGPALRSLLLELVATIVVTRAEWRRVEVVAMLGRAPLRPRHAPWQAASGVQNSWHASGRRG